MTQSRPFNKFQSFSKARRIVRTVTVATIASCIALAPTAVLAKKKGAWSVVRTQDPITGRTTCAVSALDRLAHMRFARIGALYAVVENNPDAGLLVGVSSGGRWRIPVGDILWRVDTQPYRTLKAVDNPEVANTGNPALAAAEAAKGTEPPPEEGAGLQANDADAASSANEPPLETYRATIDATMERQTALIAAMTATATMASGETAKAMLAEMREGKALLFRQQAAAPLYGLPSSQVYTVGQDTNKGHKPIPIDQSFHDGLVACGIVTP
ncbi:MAG: hypothetical protein R3E11_01810 [Sphingobium sp.]|jgi:hypothetical protein|nr:hypothetical protein [Sphingobium sp.]MCP5400283.1 hypothetical protein [Sphingomonas sp.]